MIPGPGHAQERLEFGFFFWCVIGREGVASACDGAHGGLMARAPELWIGKDFVYPSVAHFLERPVLFGQRVRCVFLDGGGMDIDQGLGVFGGDIEPAEDRADRLDLFLGGCETIG